MTLYNVHLSNGDSKARGTVSHTGVSTAFESYKVIDPALQNLFRDDGAATATGPVQLDITSGYWGAEHAVAHRRKAAGEEHVLMCERNRSGAPLATIIRPWVDGDDYSQLVADFWAAFSAGLAAGDTYALRSFLFTLGANDAQNDSYIALWDPDGQNYLGRSIQSVRIDFGNVPVFLSQLGSDVSDPNLTPARVSLIRSYYETVASRYPNVYLIDETGVPKHDGVHFTADGNMILGDRHADAMAVDGLQHDGMLDLPHRVRTFNTLADAQTYANSVQSILGDRDDNPANGGLAIRHGQYCQGPWPTTPRSESVSKHPFFDTWAVPTDPAMIANVSIDTDSNVRFADLGKWN